MTKTISLIALGISMIFVMPLGISNVSAMKCEDIKGTMKWDGEGHDDNSPSEKQFYKQADKMTFCEFVKAIDHMELKGEIKENTKHDLDWLKTTLVYQSVDEDSQKCMDKAYKHSPDDSGDKNLADYEMVDCTY